MKVSIYSPDEIELLEEDEATSPTKSADVIPIRKPDCVESCKLLWTGDLPTIPNVEDAIFVPSDNEQGWVGGFVSMRVFHLDVEEPFVVLVIVSEIGEEEEFDLA